MPPLPLLPERYEVIGLVGEGATGSVYRAVDRLLNTPVAVKIVRPNLAIHARFRARFAHEVALSSRVLHPGLVPVHDGGRLDDGRPYVVLGYADLGSLEERLAGDPEPAGVLWVLDQVLDALGFLHARGFLHQDLKPGNVLLYTSGGAQPGAWVADLGVTEALTALTMDRRGISGTPSWMAPEQLLGRSQELGPWTDLYAVGLMLYALLGAEPLPDAEAIGRADLLTQRANWKIRLRPGIPEALTRVVASLLDPEPRQRYDRAADVRRALRETAGPLWPESGSRALARTPITLGDDGEGVPRWNRVPPGRLPDFAPPEAGADVPARASLALLPLRELPLIGNEPLRQDLWDMARRVTQTGAPQVALVIGPTGAGKTRLVTSIVEALDQGGWMEQVTLRYHNPAGTHDGYRGAVRELLAPWAESRPQIEDRLARWLARDWRRPRDETAEEAARLARWCGRLKEGERSVHAAVGLAYLYRFLDAHAWRGGTALVLEDAHLAQGPGDGLAICEALLRRTVGERPVLVMATLSYEALHANPALQARVAKLEELGAARIEARPLSEDAIRTMLSDAFLLSPDLATALAPRCGGNPAFATLLLRDWAARRLLVQQPDRSYALHPKVRLGNVLPADLESLALSRVEGAMASTESPDEAEFALAATALAGTEPPTLVVRTVSPGGLDALLASGIIRQRGWRLVFEHSEVQRAAQRFAAGSPNLAILHRKLADAWGTLGRRTGADVDLPVGLHRLHGDQPAEAVAALLRAALIALAEGRAPMALDAGQLAIQAADRGESMGERLEARRLCAEALLELERPDEAIALLGQARRIGRLSERANARLQAQLARAAIQRGSYEQAQKLLQRAEAAFQAAKDQGGLVDVNLIYGSLLQSQGLFTASVERIRAALGLGVEDPVREVHARSALVNALLETGEVGDLDKEVGHLRRAAHTSGDTAALAAAALAVGRVLVYRKDTEEADRQLRHARALAATLGADRLELQCQERIAEVLAQRGDTAGASTALDSAARYALERGWIDLAAELRVQLALLQLRRGAHRRAWLEVDQATSLLEGQPHHPGWALIGVLRALSGAHEGDANAARSWWQSAWERGVAQRVGNADVVEAIRQLASIAWRNRWMDVASQTGALAPPSTDQGDAAEPDLVIDLPASRRRPTRPPPPPPSVDPTPSKPPQRRVAPRDDEPTRALPPRDREPATQGTAQGSPRWQDDAPTPRSQAPRRTPSPHRRLVPTFPEPATLDDAPPTREPDTPPMRRFAAAPERADPPPRRTIRAPSPAARAAPPNATYNPEEVTAEEIPRRRAPPPPTRAPAAPPAPPAPPAPLSASSTTLLPDDEETDPDLPVPPRVNEAIPRRRKP